MTEIDDKSDGFESGDPYADEFAKLYGSERVSFDDLSSVATDWMQAVSNQRIGEAEVRATQGFAYAYGADLRIPRPEKFGPNPTSARDLLLVHAGTVIVGRNLDRPMKVDLLSATANALYHGKRPVEGRRLILGMIKRMGAAEFKAFTFGGASTENYNELFELEMACRKELPRRGFMDMTKAVASAELGERVGSFPVAFAVLDQLPSDEQRQKTEERLAKRRTRQERRRERAIDYHLDRLAELVEQRHY